MSNLATMAREAAATIAPAASTETAPAPAVAAAPVVAAPVATAPTVDVTAVRAEARAEERARIQAIVGHAEAEGRTALAHQLAFGTDLAPEAAAGLLTAAPKAEAAPARTLTGATVPAPAIAPQAGATDKADASARLAAAVKALGPKA
jgi:hypothetical protein